MDQPDLISGLPKEKGVDSTKHGGYAAIPGTGPTGKRCKHCRHICYNEYSKRYYKCGLVVSTNGPGTDIRINSPACRRFQEAL